MIITERFNGTPDKRITTDAAGKITLYDEDGNILTRDNCRGIVFVNIPFATYMNCDSIHTNSSGDWRVTIMDSTNSQVVANTPLSVIYGWIPKSV